MTQVVHLGAKALAIHALPKIAADTPAPIHHILTIDISGSMYSDLPELRTHLKNKLATLVDDGDTVSIVWFSGRGQFGTLVSAAKVKNATDLTNLHKAIDRFLQPTGLTGFKEPLESISKMIDDLKAKTKGYLINLFFMTDGYDNQWSDGDNLALCRSLAPKVDSAVVVEYGWHCNRPLLTKMAEALGGTLIFSKDFESYVAAFEGSLKGSTKKVKVTLGHTVVGPVFALAGGRLLTFELEGKDVLVPEGLDALAYFTAAAGKAFDHTVDTNPLIFASLIPLVHAGDTAGIYSVLSALGDVAVIESFTNCFSKEDFSRFSDEVLAASVDPAKRYVAGYDPTAVPKEDAFTVLDLLDVLSASEDNLVYPYHAAFSYKRTTSGTEAKDPSAKFSPADRNAGYPVNGLVWNENRPNVSLRVKVDGNVTLPEDRPAVLPAEVPSFIYRNYTIIKDGIVHTRKLPVSLGQDSFDKLQANGLLAGEKWAPGQIYVLDYPKVPVINRAMVKATTAEETFKDVLELLKLKGEQKVFNEWRKMISPKESADLVALYGQEAADWLESVGVTSYNGFNPPSTTVKSGDVSMARELKIAAKGLSSLPKVEVVETALEAKKALKPAEKLMAGAIQRVNEVLELSGASAPGDNTKLAAWLEVESGRVTKRTRELMVNLAKRKFAVVVGQVWFSDLGSRDNTSLTIKDALLGDVQVTATLQTVEYEI